MSMKSLCIMALLVCCASCATGVVEVRKTSTKTGYLRHNDVVWLLNDLRSHAQCSHPLGTFSMEGHECCNWNGFECCLELRVLGPDLLDCRDRKE